jgi:hypothetical protein
MEKLINQGYLPEGFAEADKKDFIDYVTNHIKQFNSVPYEYESHDGKVYDIMDTWNIALRLGLTNLIKKPALY